MDPPPNAAWGTKNVSSTEYTRHPLWSILVETVHGMVMYPHHKAYVRNVVLVDRPDITYKDLALSLGVPIGEALVILHELRQEPEG
jgi:hypothetical protein